MKRFFFKFHLKSENEPLDINLDCQSCRLWQVWVNRPFIATGLRKFYLQINIQDNFKPSVIESKNKHYLTADE